MDRQALAAWQAALIATLAEGLPAEERRRRIQTDPAFRPFAQYMDGTEERCLDVASELVRKWGIFR